MNFKYLLICISLIFSFKLFAIQSTSPDSVDAISYKINLRITDFTGKKLSGFTDVKIASKINNLNSVRLDLLKLNVDSVLFNATIPVSFSHDDTILYVTIPAVNQNDTFSLRVFYNGSPVIDPSGWGGFYFTSNFAYNLGVGFDDNPHNYGRVWFPCFDNFTDRAKYEYYITVNSGHTAVCGGTLSGEALNNDGTRTFHWTLNNSIPTYLASVAVSNYFAVRDTFSGMQGEIPIAIYVVPSDSTKARNSFSRLKSILSAFETRFGPYRWERVGYVGVPFNSGAMEHACNIAYPNVCIDGGFTYETLLAHELAHHWFGNLITCSTASDMWINEGWATYCESIYKEILFGTQNFKNYMRSKHSEVVRYLHIEDSTYRAVAGIPHNYTYSSTVYEKGSGVAHSLRGYLGDTLFFGAVKALLDEYKLKHISSTEMRDFISSYTGINLDDFFNFWVFSPGFTHFSVDSFSVTQGENDYLVSVYVRQKLKGAQNFANSNRLELAFMSASWQIVKRSISFSGETGSAVIEIPFHPVAVMADIDEKLADATVDNYMTLKNIGTFAFDKTYFSANVTSASDSAFIRVEHNWVKPDSFITAIPKYKLSPNRYWKVDGIMPSGFKAKGRFSYNASASTQLDNQLITNNIDSLRILFRENTAINWRPVKFARSGNAYQGTIIVDTLRLGEYTLALYDWDMPLNVIHNYSDNNLINVFPNPSDSNFTLEVNSEEKSKLIIYDILGKNVFEKELQKGKSTVIWDSSNFMRGMYFVEMVQYEKVVSIRRITKN